jgi:hydroxymethylglutaryl-CoA lyase|tara:strand:- start:5085 stop:5939 length:855 start_codon:yes stop_codon:yes gene_type:complete
MDKKISIFEVGPRDGLQNIKNEIPINRKIELIDILSATGIKKIECGSFVSAKWVPQMRGTDQIFQEILRKDGVKYTALTPNLKGFENAMSVKVDEIAVFAAASETFSQKNVNCSIAESLERFEDIFKKARQKKIPVRGYVSCIVECPYEGKVKPEKVLEVTSRLLDMGCYEVSLGDTIGKGTPKTVETLLKVICENLHAQQLAGHFHDTSDTAIKNVEIALKYGITTFDTAIGGLGGCPYAPGAKGNLSTVQLINAIGINSFIGALDLEKLLYAEKYLKSMLKN